MPSVVIRDHVGSNPIYHPKVLLVLPSSSGLGHLPFTQGTGVQIPLGVQVRFKRRSGLELVPAQAHNLNDVGSNPTSATSL